MPKTRRIATSVAAVILQIPAWAAVDDVLFAASLDLRKSTEAAAACKPREGAEWATSAGERLRISRGDTKSVLDAVATDATDAARRLTVAITETATEMERNRTAGATETAQATLARFRQRYPQCGSELTANETALLIQKKQAAALAKRAESLVDRDPRRARKLYEHAHKLNREDEFILAGMQYARGRLPRRSYRAVKILGWTVFTAALGTGGYITIDRHLAKKRTATPAWRR